MPYCILYDENISMANINMTTGQIKILHIPLLKYKDKKNPENAMIVYNIYSSINI